MVPTWHRSNRVLIARERAVRHERLRSSVRQRRIRYAVRPDNEGFQHPKAMPDGEEGS